MHALFETQYDEMEVAVDEIAERIRTIEEYAAGSIEQFQALNQVPSEPSVPNSKEMITQLMESQGSLLISAAIYIRSRGC